jgi:hypothetical protein
LMCSMRAFIFFFFAVWIVTMATALCSTKMDRGARRGNCRIATDRRLSAVSSF